MDCPSYRSVDIFAGGGVFDYRPLNSNLVEEYQAGSVETYAEDSQSCIAGQYNMSIVSARPLTSRKKGRGSN